MTAVADDVLAETRAFNAELERQLAANPATNEMPVEVARRQRLEGGGIFPPTTFLPERARDLTIAGRLSQHELGAAARLAFIGSTRSRLRDAISST